MNMHCCLFGVDALQVCLGFRNEEGVRSAVL